MTISLDAHYGLVNELVQVYSTHVTSENAILRGPRPPYRLLTLRMMSQKPLQSRAISVQVEGNGDEIRFVSRKYSSNPLQEDLFFVPA